MVKFKDFSRPMSVFPVLFKANLIFKTFQNKFNFQDSPVYSSTFQACVNPVFSYSPIQTYVVGAQKKCLIETFLLSSHSICLGL